MQARQPGDDANVSSRLPFRFGSQSVFRHQERRMKGQDNVDLQTVSGLTDGDPLGRRIRMLEYDLAQRSQRTGPGTEESEGTVDGNVEGQWRFDDCEATGHPCERDAASAGDRVAMADSACAPPCLKGLRVAVIGGLDRLETHYRRVVEDLGGQFCFHNGNCRGGCEILKSVVGPGAVVAVPRCGRRGGRPAAARPRFPRSRPWRNRRRSTSNGPMDSASSSWFASVRRNRTQSQVWA